MTAKPAPGATAAVPRPAASVVLVRPGAGGGVEVYMIRRDRSMRFLGGWFAFPGGKVDAGDGGDDVVARCRGLTREGAGRLLPELDGVPPIAFWVTAARELCEETGLLLATDGDGRPVDLGDAAVAAGVERVRRGLMAADTPLADLLAKEGWWLDLGSLRYLSHFITPPSSPIRFTARFFLAPVPEGQSPRLYTEEASEGFWIDPRDGLTRFEKGDMPMAEPGSSGLSYLAEFASTDALWSAHVDGRHKFHGIDDRLIALGLRLAPRPGAPARR